MYEIIHLLLVSYSYNTNTFHKLPIPRLSLLASFSYSKFLYDFGCKITPKPPHSGVPDFSGLVPDGADWTNGTTFLIFGTRFLEVFDYLCTVRIRQIQQTSEGYGQRLRVTRRLREG
jgi:hypothetical protein